MQARIEAHSVEMAPDDEGREPLVVSKHQVRLAIEGLEAGWELVHVVRCGAVEAVIWSAGRNGGVEKEQVVTLNRTADGPERGSGSRTFGLGDCIELLDCLTDAVQWMQNRQLVAVPVPPPLHCSIRDLTEHPYSPLTP